MKRSEYVLSSGSLQRRLEGLTCHPTRSHFSSTPYLTILTHPLFDGEATRTRPIRHSLRQVRVSTRHATATRSPVPCAATVSAESLEVLAAVLHP